MSVTQTEHPDKRRLLIATAIAAVAAAILLVTAVLPAEYGVDPLGTGRALGLAAMSDRPAPAEPVPVSAGAAYTPVAEGPAARYGAAYKTEKVSFTLGPYEYLEYKYHLQKGASMVFSWRANGTVGHDFHGEPDGGTSETSYDQRETDHSSGSVVAPFTGIHGWFWENTGGTPVTIQLLSSGFYDHGLEIRSNKSRTVHNLTAIQ
jgi:hypothetical protein